MVIAKSTVKLLFPPSYVLSAPSDLPEMLQPRTFLTALRATPLQRGILRTIPSKTPLPRLPQPLQPLTQRLQQRAISQLVRSRIPARPFATPSWRNLKLSPFRTLRRYSDDKPAQSLSDRLKELSRKYGWAAVGVYLGLSALDFPFCFMAVRLVGPDRIGEVEHAIVDYFWHAVAIFAPSMRPQEREVVEDVEAAKEEVAAEAKLKKEDASECKHVARECTEDALTYLKQAFGRNYYSHTECTNRSSSSGSL